MKTVVLTILTVLTLSAKAQTAKLQGVESRTIKFSLYSPVKQRAFASITDAAGNIKWAKKVKIKKGASEPHLFFKGLPAGAYVIRIGDFFRQEIKLPVLE